jgi:hypothetical protein
MEKTSRLDSVFLAVHTANAAASLVRLFLTLRLPCCWLMTSAEIRLAPALQFSTKQQQDRSAYALLVPNLEQYANSHPLNLQKPIAITLIFAELLSGKKCFQGAGAQCLLASLVILHFANPIENFLTNITLSHFQFPL